MNRVIVYQSKTGHTEAYAKLLAERLNCKVLDSKAFNRNTASEYNQYIFMGWLRAAKIAGLNAFLRKVDPDSNIVIGAVGASPKSHDYTEKVRNANFQDKNSYPLYYFQGGFDPEKLTFPLKVMLKKVADSIKKKQEKNPEILTDEDKEFLSFFQNKHSEVSEENLEDILNYLQE